MSFFNTLEQNEELEVLRRAQADRLAGRQAHPARIPYPSQQVAGRQQERWQPQAHREEIPHPSQQAAGRQQERWRPQQDQWQPQPDQWQRQQEQ